MDQDKNIVLKRSYFSLADVQAFVTPVISYTPTSGITTATPVTFSTPALANTCAAAGLTYTWTYGDGTLPYTSSSNTSPPHTYAAPGTYSAGLTVTSPFLGSQTASPVNVTVIQATAAVTYVTHAEDAGITSITFTGLGGAPNYYFTTFPQTVVPGSYNISIVPSGSAYDPGTGKGYTNIVFTDGSFEECFNYTGGNFAINNYTVVAGHTLNFAVYNNNSCP